jgi:hypothetical protein
LCLATLGGLFAAKAVSVPVPELVDVADMPTTETDALRGTLTKADKFAVTYVLPAEEVPPLPIASTSAQLEPVKPEPGTGLVSRDQPTSTAKQVAVPLPKPVPSPKPLPLPKPRPKSKLAKNGNAIDRSKAAPEIKTCGQQDAIVRFLISAGISPRCET